MLSTSLSSDYLDTPLSYRSAVEGIFSEGPSLTTSAYQYPKGSTNTASKYPQQQQQQLRPNSAPGVTSNGLDGGEDISTPVGAGSGSGSGGGHHPASYMEVLEMLERGETPPGIRDDIDDKPPNPEQPPPPSRMKPPPKPWERRESNGNDNSTPVTMGGMNINTSIHNERNSSSRGQENTDDVLLYNRGRGGVTAPSGVITTQPGGLDLSPVVTDEATSVGRSAHSNNASGSVSSTDKPASTISPLHDLLSHAGSRPMSIFEAATSKESPSVIAGRLSPADQRRRGVATPSALFPDTGATSPLVRSPIIRSPSANSPMRSPSPRDGGDSSGEGSGLGRPASKGWRPPPIPMPTVSGSTGREEESLGSKSGKLGLGQAISASQESLGADFASG